MPDEDTKTPSHKQVTKILDAALSSGAIEGKMSIQDVIGRLGGGIDEVAGYVVAWEKYVLVVAEFTDIPEIVLKRR